MRAGSAAANLLWAAAVVPAWRRHRSALNRPADVQQARLRGLLRHHAASDYGRRHHFDSIRTVAEFQDRVPIVRYEDLAGEIDRIARGEPAVLTTTPVARLLPSGGSSRGVKLLPFTEDFRRELSAAVDPWMAEIFRRYPSVLGGPAYWSITPPAACERPAAITTPVGFDDDVEYLGAARRAIARQVMAVPSEVGKLRDAEAFRYRTMLLLLVAKHLRLVSVWHPSFFGGLLDLLERRFDDLVADVHKGGPGLRPDARRAGELRRCGPSPRAIWPRLTLVSAWADGPAAPYAAALSERLGVPIQSKGLLATEGVISIPFAGRHPLAVRSHFLEFVDARGHVRLAHELEAHARYRVVVTTGAGLYRYDLGDEIEVDGVVGATPSVRFVGRADRVSDRFGEKLSETFVADVLVSLFADRQPRFAMVAPDACARGMRYALFVEDDDIHPGRLAAGLEAGLRRNPQYAWCVDIGQLSPAAVVPVADGAVGRYLDACVARGQRLGDVKPVALDPDEGWGAILAAGARVTPTE